MQLLNPAIIMLPTTNPPVLSLSTTPCRSASSQGIFGPPINTLLTPICLTIRMLSLVISRRLSGAQILGVFGPSWGIPGPCGPLYSVPSAAAAGNTAAAGNAADSAAVEQMPFIRALLEKSELMVFSSGCALHSASPGPASKPGTRQLDNESTLHRFSSL